MTLVWFLSRVSSHVDQQHVPSFEGPLLSDTPPPLADKLFPALLVDVLRIDMADERIQGIGLFLAVFPEAEVVVRLFNCRVAVVDPVRSPILT